jgi:hypothetical protein
MSRIKQLPNDLQENLMSSRRDDFLATAIFWTHRDSVVLDLYVSGLGQARSVVLVHAVRSAMALSGRDSRTVASEFVEKVLDFCEKSGPFAPDGMALNRIMGPVERAQVLTAQLNGQDSAQRFPPSSAPVERAAALHNFALNFLPSTNNEFIAAYEGISVSALKSRLNRARTAGLLAQREGRIGGRGSANAR